MGKTYGKLELEETDNGWIVRTSYFCHRSEKQMVFSKWKEVIQFIEMAMGVKP